MKSESLRFPIKAMALGENKNLLNSFRQQTPNKVEKLKPEDNKSRTENLLIQINKNGEMFRSCNQFIDFKNFIKTVSKNQTKKKTTKENYLI